MGIYSTLISLDIDEPNHYFEIDYIIEQINNTNYIYIKKD